MLQIEHVANFLVANCTCCTLHVFQIAYDANCTCCKLHMFQIACFVYQNLVPVQKSSFRRSVNKLKTYCMITCLIMQLRTVIQYCNQVMTLIVLHWFHLFINNLFVIFAKLNQVQAKLDRVKLYFQFIRQPKINHPTAGIVLVLDPLKSVFRLIGGGHCIS